MSKKRRKNAPQKMIISSRDLLLKHSRDAARATRIHKDKNKYDRREKKAIPNE